MALRGFSQYMEWERGFRGWLVFFFFSACLVALVRAYLVVRIALLLPGLLLRAIPAPVKLAFVVELLIELALLAGTIHGLRLFAREDPRTPRFWTAFLLLSIPAALAFDALSAFMAAAFDPTTTFENAFWSIVLWSGVRGVLVSLGWAAYWSNSTRVLRTYGTTGLNRLPAPTAAEARMVV